MNMRRTTVLLLLVMLVASACIRSNTTVVVNEDGSGTIEAIIAIDPNAVADIAAEFDEDAASELGSAEELCEDFRADNENFGELPADAQITPYTEDGLCGERAFVAFGAGEATQVLTGFVDNPDGANLSQDADGGWSFEIPFDAEDLAVEDDLAGAPPGLVDAVFEDFEITYEVTLPGRPVDGGNNADRVDGATFFWEVDILNPPDRFFAQTEPGDPDGSGGGWLKWLLIALVVIALGALAFFLLNKRNAAAVGNDPTQPYTPPGTGAAAVGSTPVSGTTPGAMGTPSPSAAPEPSWDAQREAWVIQDPQRGLLVHDAASGEWRPA